MKTKERWRFARKLIIHAGKLLTDVYFQRKSKRIERFKKGKDDPVTVTDILIETYIVEKIFKYDPDCQVLTEESGLLGYRESPIRWILDPLDGTVNYLHLHPHFAISLALEKEGEVLFGLVYNPLRRELFEAFRGQGAFRNGKRIHVSKTSMLNQALIATGFNASVMENLDSLIQVFKGFLHVTMGVRRSGSAALDLCYVAWGRYDGFYERGLSPWDVAAGLLIVEEAGGLYTGFRNEPTTIYDRDFIVSNGKIHHEMLQTIEWAEQNELA